MSDDDKKREIIIKTTTDYQNSIENIHENHFTATQPEIPKYESFPSLNPTNFWGNRRTSEPGKTDLPITKSVKLEKEEDNRCIIL